MIEEIKGVLEIKRIPFKKFPESTYLLLPNNIVPLCSKCGDEILSGEYGVLCSDLDKIWHEKCFDRTHFKENIIFSQTQQQHYDFLIIINSKEDASFIWKSPIGTTILLKIPFRPSKIVP